VAVPTLTDLRRPRHAEAIISCSVPSCPQRGHDLFPFVSPRWRVVEHRV